MSTVVRHAVIKNADMDEGKFIFPFPFSNSFRLIEMQDEAIEVAKQALLKWDIEKDIAEYIKVEFDKKHAPNWHCIVGMDEEFEMNRAEFRIICYPPG